MATWSLNAAGRAVTTACAERVAAARLAAARVAAERVASRRQRARSSIRVAPAPVVAQGAATNLGPSGVGMRLSVFMRQVSRPRTISANTVLALFRSENLIDQTGAPYRASHFVRSASIGSSCSSWAFSESSSALSRFRSSPTGTNGQKLPVLKP